eukprot:CAMPEP_0179972652 /NCGR_PEP_ID=MMETSP0983-20121128/36869_1 /TAXON_ID=483367 /ORGANISM="non described non described, Strain CCMP 2436" /LENGTH=140 /DNA_ID=CAMNT_0021888245 /DNA_START=63 /DNA_END=483 /DNA_ORIENTATION=+
MAISRSTLEKESCSSQLRPRGAGQPLVGLPVAAGDPHPGAPARPGTAARPGVAARPGATVRPTFAFFVVWFAMRPACERTVRVMLHRVAVNGGLGCDRAPPRLAAKLEQVGPALHLHEAQGAAVGAFARVAAISEHDGAR